MDLSFLVCCFKVWNGHHLNLCIVYNPVISQYLIAVVRLFLKLTNNLRFPASIFAGNAVKWLCASLVLYVLHVMHYWVGQSLALWLPSQLLKSCHWKASREDLYKSTPCIFFCTQLLLQQNCYLYFHHDVMSVRLVASYWKWGKISVVLQSRLKKLSLILEKNEV